MRLLDRLQRRYGRYAVPNLTLVIVMGQTLAYIVMQTERDLVQRMLFIPKLVMEGEYWRIGSFIFVPPVTNIFFFFIAMMVFHMMGSALEHSWGTFKYNMFLLVGYIATVAVAFIYPDQIATNAFIGTAVFLAFAWLYPDYVFYLFFILPVKVKWLALLTWIGLIYALIVGDMSTRLFVLSGIANFLLFFGEDIYLRVRNRGRRMQQKARAASEAAKPRHECAVCGATDKTDPTLEFRYCSKCEGAPCYCENHIQDHAHTGGAS